MVTSNRISLSLIGAVLVIACNASACVMVGDTSLPPEIHINLGVDSSATWIVGTVNNVCVDSVRVVLWALTNHWYDQPICPPATYVQPNSLGNWASSSNGWSRLVALLVKYPGYTVPESCQHWDHPSLDPGVLAWDGAVLPPTLEFSGYTWIKKHGGPRSPGNDDNRFSDYNAWLEQDGLHLRTTNDGLHWWCAEVLLDHSLGYGTYTFQLSRRVDSLDAHAVFAGFIYDSTNREIDIEFSRAIGMPPDNNSQYVLQPFDNPANRHTFSISSDAVTSHRFVWTPDGITFTSWRGLDDIPSPDDIIQTWTYTGASNPTPRGRDRMRFNLWLDGAQAEHADEVVVGSFQYLPIMPPSGVTIALEGHEVRLRWRGDVNPYYRIYTDTQADGPFATLLGTTTDTTYTISNGDANAIRFYCVMGSTTP